MTLSFIVIAYNEEETISKLFSELKAQDYPHEKMEIILVDLSLIHISPAAGHRLLPSRG